jgi:kynurenine formamidase
VRIAKCRARRPFRSKETIMIEDSPAPGPGPRAKLLVRPKDDTGWPGELSANQMRSVYPGQSGAQAAVNDGEIDGLPSFEELLTRSGAPAGSTWGLWGAQDRCGCLNLVTPEASRRGAASVVSGKSFGLNLDLRLPDPPLFGRSAFRHDVVWLSSGRGHDEILSNWNPQGSSQWDGFRHMRSPADGFYNGAPDEDLGVDYWAHHGIVTRGVLADVEGWRRHLGRPLDHAASDRIDPEDLDACLAEEGVQVRSGDVLLIRTGWLTWYRELSRDGRDQLARTAVAAGLRSGRPSARWLWDHRVAAVAADNPAVEASPVYGLMSDEDLARLESEPASAHELVLHMALLPMLGMPIGELWDLDDLAADCAEDGQYTFLLTSAPLNLYQGVGSPANAIATK